MTQLDDRERIRIGKAAVQRLQFPECTTVDKFNPFEVANAIEYEASRVAHLPIPKVTLSMDLDDARALCRILRGER